MASLSRYVPSVRLRAARNAVYNRRHFSTSSSTQPHSIRFSSAVSAAAALGDYNPKVSRIGDQIVIVEDFLTPKECKELIELSETVGYEKSSIDTRKTRSDANPKAASAAVMRKDIRNNYRLAFEDEELSLKLLDRLKQVSGAMDALRARSGEPVGLSSHFRFYRYHEGQRFKPHADGTIKDPTKGVESRWTLLVQLNSEFSGGETAFYQGSSDPVAPSPKTGQLIMFVHRVLHEGRLVHAGTKYALRSDVMFPATK